jgi:hypothetical protein
MTIEQRAIAKALKDINSAIPLVGGLQVYSSDGADLAAVKLHLNAAQALLSILAPDAEPRVNSAGVPVFEGCE